MRAFGWNELTMNARPDAEMKAEERSTLLTLINGCWTTQAIAAAADLGIAAQLARTPQDAASLAEATSCHEPSLLRLMRALTSLGLCSQRGDGRFELTTLGTWLDPDAVDSLDAWARMRALRWAEWGDLSESVRTGECHQKRHAGSDDFSRYDGSAHARLFHDAMVKLTRRVSAGVAEAVVFRGDEILVDVGGGSGEMLAALMATHPSMSGIVLDLAHAREGAEEHLGRAGLGDRSKFMTGSFFEALPDTGDVYILKSVLHNWDDDRASRILSSCRVAMKAGARLLVVERLRPEQWADSDRHRACAASDLNMLVTLSGRERTEAEFGALLEAGGFRISRVHPVGADFHVLECQ